MAQSHTYQRRGWDLNVHKPKAQILNQYPLSSLLISLPLSEFLKVSSRCDSSTAGALSCGWNPAMHPYVFLWLQLTFLFSHALLCLIGPLCPCHVLA